MLDNWQRIEQIIKWAGYPSVSAFAREIGLNRSENLYQIKRGNNGISKDLAEMITVKLPEISKAWLLTGEGTMLRSDSSCSRHEIPFFKADALQMVLSDEAPEPSYRISFPLFDGSDFAAFSLSSAMEPEIPRGCMLFFQRVLLGSAVPGEIYLVVSPCFSGIRYLRREPGSSDVRLVPVNKTDFDEVVIPASSIEKLYIVRGMAIGR